MSGPVPAVESLATAIGSVTGLSPAAKHAAALVICGHAQDRTDAEQLLDAAGLLPVRSGRGVRPATAVQVDLGPVVAAMAGPERRCGKCGYLASKCQGHRRRPR